MYWDHLKCPFGVCQSKDVQLEPIEGPDGEMRWYVECHDCGASGPTAPTEHLAAQYWDDTLNRSNR